MKESKIGGIIQDIQSVGKQDPGPVPVPVPVTALETQEEGSQITKIFNSIKSELDNISMLSAILTDGHLTEDKINNCVKPLMLSSEKALKIAEDFLSWKKIEQVRNNNKEKMSDSDKFVSKEIHDLKTKFNAIVQFSELIDDGSLSEDEIKGYNSLIISCIGQARAIVESYWNSQGEAGLTKIEVKISNFEISRYVNENFIDDLLKEAEIKEIKINIETNEKLFVTADPIILQSVLRDLISNAIKFTRIGGVISVSFNKIDDSIEIFVKDNGVGISKERINSLFDSMDTTIGTGEEVGTGFGLLLCKDLIEKMNGNIRVESGGKDKGATFILTLPAGSEESSN